MVGGIRVWLAVVALARGPGTGGPATAGHALRARFLAAAVVALALEGGKSERGKEGEIAQNDADLTYSTGTRTRPEPARATKWQYCWA